LPGGHPLHRDAEAVHNQLIAAIDDTAPHKSHIAKMSYAAHPADMPIVAEIKH
jgi:hypothetical protein